IFAAQFGNRTGLYASRHLSQMGLVEVDGLFFIEAEESEVRARGRHPNVLLHKEHRRSKRNSATSAFRELHKMAVRRHCGAHHLQPSMKNANRHNLEKSKREKLRFILATTLTNQLRRMPDPH